MSDTGGNLDWWEYSELAIVAMGAALARGVNWRDPKTGSFSVSLMVQTVSTAGVIAVGAAAAQAKWNFPVPITAFVAVVGALVGIPFFVAAFTAILDTAKDGVRSMISSWFGAKTNAKQSDGSTSGDKPNA